MNTSTPVVMVLGRYGDILSALPIAYALSRQQGPKPLFLVAKPFASILDGISYVTPVVWDGDYARPAAAVLWFRRHHGNHKIITAQSYMYADQSRRTESYQKESWRIAGWLDKFGTLPLVIDRRSKEREAELLTRFPSKNRLVLVAPDGISSKYAHADELVQQLREVLGPDITVVDLRVVKAERVYDLLGLFDAAALLVTVDTVHLHLARASKVPVIAITNQDWKGSIPPPNTCEQFKYADAVESVVWAAHLFFTSSVSKVYHVADLFGEADRHDRAQKTWAATGFVVLGRKDWLRTSLSMGETRVMHFLKDVLRDGAESVLHDHDVILWTNDDIGLDPGIADWATQHVARWGAASMRRNSVHMGRDLFAFRKDWLEQHWDEIPDFLLGAPFWDLCLAAMIRNSYGIATTKENLSDDIFPAETADRFALHEDHPSSWAGPNENTYPANLHNKKLFFDWVKTHAPTLKL